MRRVVLSERLQMLADMVTAGSRVADVGCDHGFLSIWLIQAGVSPKVLATDVRKGPLAAAREHVEAYGLGDYIETRLSDGLKNCEASEAETLVCAGMGGRLMEQILTESMEKVKVFKELILQPQSELREFRAFLRREGFAILQENAVCEDGKFYFAMKAVPGVVCGRDADSGAEGLEVGGAESRGAEGKDGNAGEAEDRGGDAGVAQTSWDKGFEASREQRVYDRFGEKLISAKNPVLQQYLQWRRETLAQLVHTLRTAGIPEADNTSGAADTMEAADTLEIADIPEAAGTLEKAKTGSKRQQARLEELLVELADVEYALKRMQ